MKVFEPTDIDIKPYSHAIVRCELRVGEVQILIDSLNEALSSGRLSTPAATVIQIVIDKFNEAVNRY